MVFIGPLQWVVIVMIVQIHMVQLHGILRLINAVLQTLTMFVEEGRFALYETLQYFIM